MIIHQIQDYLVRASLKVLVILTTLAGLTSASSAVSLAIILDLSPHAKTNIITSIMKAGNLDTRNVSLSHVTIGFVENIPDQMTAKQIGRSAENFLNQQGVSIRFEVLNCQNLFGGNIMAIVPSANSTQVLQNLNTDLGNHLNGVKINGFQPILNVLTQPGNYTPHISLQRGNAAANDLNAMNIEVQILAANRNPPALFFNITTASYRVM